MTVASGGIQLTSYFCSVSMTKPLRYMDRVTNWLEAAPETPLIFVGLYWSMYVSSVGSPGSMAKTGAAAYRITTNEINCVAFGNTAEFIADYAKKGDRLLISGELNINKYEKDNDTKYFTEVSVFNVQLLESKKKD